MEEHVMPTGDGHLAGPLRLGPTDHIRQVQTTVRMPAGTLTHDLDGVNRRYRGAAQKGDQLGDRGNTKDPNAFNEFRLSGLPQWHDHPGEAGLSSRQRRHPTRAGWTRSAARFSILIVAVST
jgi:hypothetical protein